MIGVCLLAAGNSIRYGGIKLLELVAGKPMYLSALEKIQDLNLMPKVVVTQYGEIEKAGKERGFIIVKNPCPEEGVSSSIKLGINKILELEPETEAILFCVCDQPFLTKESIIKLVEQFWETEKGIACAAYKNALGNPCIFRRKYFEELLLLEGDTGGKKIINRVWEDVLPVQVKEEKELIDVDTKLTAF